MASRTTSGSGSRGAPAAAVPARAQLPRQLRQHGARPAYIVSGARVRRSLLSSNVRVEDGAHIEQSVLLPNLHIGAGCVLRRAVVDKYCRLPPNLVVGVDAEADRRRFHVTERGVSLITPEMLGQYLRLRS